MSAHDTILAACRGNSFRTRGTWGMRCDLGVSRGRAFHVYSGKELA